jgi:catechol 2,3-dioxygenase-like lactoylglutathione lyase family enzyme
MRVSFLAGLGPLVRDPEASLRFFRDLLGIPLAGDDYVAADNWEGLRHFGQWTLADAAESIFGTREWPADIPAPQVNLEFDVDSEAAVEDAARDIKAAGYTILSGPKKEPWNQTVVRLLGPEGMLVGITYTPWLHEGQVEGSAEGDPEQG